MHSVEPVLTRMTSRFTSAVTVAVLATGCGGTTLTEVGGPGGVRCQSSLGAPVPVLGSRGGAITLPVVAARDCAWRATSDAGWLQVAPRDGQGAHDLTLIAAENPQPQPRSGSFLLNDQRFTVTQEARPAGSPRRPFAQPPRATSPGSTPR